jgi:3-methyl-2-oxobutanoate hydroxymethyltransferase
LTDGYVPRFAKAYANLRGTITEAVVRYRDEVRGGQFPDAKRAFK